MSDPALPPHPLDGKWVLGGPKGRQGQIVGVDEVHDVALVQCYSWVSGEPTEIEPWPVTSFYRDDEWCWQIFDNHTLWRHAGEAFVEYQ